MFNLFGGPQSVLLARNFPPPQGQPQPGKEQGKAAAFGPGSSGQGASAFGLSGSGPTPSAVTPSAQPGASDLFGSMSVLPSAAAAAAGGGAAAPAATGFSFLSAPSAGAGAAATSSGFSFGTQAAAAALAAPSAAASGFAFGAGAASTAPAEAAGAWEVAGAVKKKKPSFRPGFERSGTDAPSPNHSASASAAATEDALRGAEALRSRLGVAEAGLHGSGERERESAQAAAAAAARARAAEERARAAEERARAAEERARAAEAAVARAETRAGAAALAVRAAQEGAAAAEAERAQLQSTVESLRREIAALTSVNSTSAAAAPAPHMRLEVPSISEAALLTPTGQPFLAALQATPDAHELGFGNTGTVRAAQWLRGGAPGGSVPVAVKTVLLGRGVSAEDEAKFRREAAVQADLSHPHVAAVHGMVDSAVGATRALHVVMELGSGGGLDALVKPGGALHSGSATLPLGSPARLARVARLGAQAALGLLQAHARGYAHCDVKLENLLLGSGGRVLVTDFGIAFRVRQGGRPLAPAGSLQGQRVQLGTFKYMPPENFEDCPGYTGQPPCDVYALAYALLELAQGEQLPEPTLLGATAVLPERGSALAALGIPCEGRNLRPQLPETVHPRLAALIQACWAADPRARPTMAEVARQLLDMAQ